jgi:hypothetical protein
MTLSLGGIGWTGGTRQYLARGKPPPHFQRIKEKQSHELPERQSLGWQLLVIPKSNPESSVKVLERHTDRVKVR